MKCALLRHSNLAAPSCSGDPDLIGALWSTPRTTLEAQGGFWGHSCLEWAVQPWHTAQDRAESPSPEGPQSCVDVAEVAVAVLGKGWALLFEGFSDLKTP